MVAHLTQQLARFNCSCKVVWWRSCSFNEAFDARGATFGCLARARKNDAPGSRSMSDSALSFIRKPRRFSRSSPRNIHDGGPLCCWKRRPECLRRHPRIDACGSCLCARRHPDYWRRGLTRSFIIRRGGFDINAMMISLMPGISRSMSRQIASRFGYTIWPVRTVESLVGMGVPGETIETFQYTYADRGTIKCI